MTAVKKGLEDLDEEVGAAKTNDIMTASESRPYFDAKRRLDEMQRFRQILDMKIASEQIDVALPKTGMVEIVDTAKPGLRPVKPNKPLNIALGIIIGLVVGVGLAFFIEYLDTSVKTIDDVERSLQSPVLGVIPQNVGLLMDEGSESPHAEAYRVLRTNLLFSRKDDKLNTVAVVSAGAGEGKSTTVFNLASVFAQSGQRVLMVDSDLRRPTLHKMLKITNSLGLTNYLLKQNTLEEVIQTTSLPTLDFMASGKLPSSSLGILSSAQMKDLIGELKQRYDFVFFDSPPIMGVSDASILASEVDMTMQVIQYRRYPQPMNIRAKQLIEKVGGNLVGIVLNNINMSQDESYYYYSGYYHDYYYRSEETRPGQTRGRQGRGKDEAGHSRRSIDRWLDCNEYNESLSESGSMGRSVWISCRRYSPGAGCSSLCAQGAVRQIRRAQRRGHLATTSRPGLPPRRSQVTCPVYRTLPTPVQPYRREGQGRWHRYAPPEPDLYRRRQDAGRAREGNPRALCSQLLQVHDRHGELRSADPLLLRGRRGEAARPPDLHRAHHSAQGDRLGRRLHRLCQQDAR